MARGRAGSPTWAAARGWSVAVRGRRPGLPRGWPVAIWGRRTEQPRDGVAMWGRRTGLPWGGLRLCAVWLLGVLGLAALGAVRGGLLVFNGVMSAHTHDDIDWAGRLAQLRMA